MSDSIPQKVHENSRLEIHDLKKIVQGLIALPGAASFMRPLAKSNLLDSSSDINLGSIYRNLRKERYADVKEALNDLELALNNCFRSSEVESNAHQKARKLSEWVKAHLAEFSSAGTQQRSVSQDNGRLSEDAVRVETSEVKTSDCNKNYSAIPSVLPTFSRSKIHEWYKTHIEGSVAETGRMLRHRHTIKDPISETRQTRTETKNNEKLPLRKMVSRLKESDSVSGVAVSSKRRRYLGEQIALLPKGSLEEVIGILKLNIENSVHSKEMIRFQKDTNTYTINMMHLPDETVKRIDTHLNSGKCS